MRRSLLALGVGGLLLMGCGTLNHSETRPQMPPVDSRTCNEKQSIALGLLLRIPLKVSFLGAEGDCVIQGYAAGMVTAAEVQQTLADAGIKSSIDIIPPPNLRPEAARVTGPLQLRIPQHLSARSGTEVPVELSFFNAGTTGKLAVGENSYDYELLDATGKVVSFRGAWAYAAYLYAPTCEAQGTCTFLPITVQLASLVPGTSLVLPAGDYTLRVKLSDLNWQGQKLDFGVFDIPLTVTP